MKNKSEKETFEKITLLKRGNLKKNNSERDKLKKERERERVAEYEQCVLALLHAPWAQRQTVSCQRSRGRPRDRRPSGVQSITSFGNRSGSMPSISFFQFFALTRCSSTPCGIACVTIIARTSAVVRCIQSSQLSSSIVEASFFLLRPSINLSIFICVVRSIVSCAPVITHEQQP